jgi:hypothetical protein
MFQVECILINLIREQSDNEKDDNIEEVALLLMYLFLNSLRWY